MIRRDTTNILKKYSQFFLILIIFSFALTAVISIYNVGGINWDFIAEVLWAKSIINPSFYHALFSGNLANVINYGNNFYFESIRPPLIGLLIAPFVIIGGSNFIPLYLTFGLLLLLFSVIYLSKNLKVSSLLLTLLFFTPYVIFFFFMLTGTEIIAISFLLIFIGLLLKKRWESGIMIAIASLAKYNAIVFILLLFILPKKARKKAFISSILVMIPWFIFNTIVWGNPIYSYTLSTGSFVRDSQGFFNITVIIKSLQLILPDLIPAFAIIVLLLIIYFWKNKSIHKLIQPNNITSFSISSIFSMNYKYKVVILVLIISWISWLLGAFAGSLNDSPREGYIIYIGIALIFALLITDLSKNIILPNKQSLRPYVIALLFIITVGMLISAFNSIYTNYPFGGYGSTNPIYKTVTNTLAVDGLSNCNVISNNWVYLLYIGIKAHYPYSYNATEQHYPIVYFTKLGSQSKAVNFNNVTSRLNYTNFYIAFPRNWTCSN